MTSDIIFLELLKETTELMRDYRPFSRGTCSRQISLVLQRALIKALPKVLTDYNLNSSEILFLSVLLVEPDACRDVIKHFSRFWAGTYEGSLRTQILLERSIKEGNLKQFIEEDGGGRIRVKADFNWRILAALTLSENSE
jgi:hypothetical protein